MKYEEFIDRVAESAGVSKEDAEALTRATLTTLAERITGGEARDLADQLPLPLQNPVLGAEEEAEAFTFEEFVRRTAERAGTDPTVAEMAVDAVMATLRDAVTPDEFDDVISQLPEDFKRLAARGPAEFREAGQDVEGSDRSRGLAGLLGRRNDTYVLRTGGPSASDVSFSRSPKPFPPKLSRSAGSGVLSTSHARSATF